MRAVLLSTQRLSNRIPLDHRLRSTSISILLNGLVSPSVFLNPPRQCRGVAGLVEWSNGAISSSRLAAPVLTVAGLRVFHLWNLAAVIYQERRDRQRRLAGHGHQDGPILGLGCLYGPPC